MDRNFVLTGSDNVIFVKPLLLLLLFYFSLDSTLLLPLFKMVNAATDSKSKDGHLSQINQRNTMMVMTEMYRCIEELVTLLAATSVS